MELVVGIEDDEGIRLELTRNIAPEASKCCGIRDDVAVVSTKVVRLYVKQLIEWICFGLEKGVLPG